MTPPFSRLPKRYFQAIASVTALVAVLLSSLGIVVLPSATQDTSVAFPCMGGTCGCNSAAECWQSCCCNTPVERLAWAHANDVNPPESLLKVLAALPKVQSLELTGACCSEFQPSDDCLAESDTAEQVTDCHKTGRIVLLSAINKCRGLASYIAIFGTAICEPIPVHQIDHAAATERLEVLDDCFASANPSPPTPPPRVFG